MDAVLCGHPWLTHGLTRCVCCMLTSPANPSAVGLLWLNYEVSENNACDPRPRRDERCQGTCCGPDELFWLSLSRLRARVPLP